MEQSNLSRKLLIEPAQRCLVLNAPSGYVDRLDPLPEGAVVRTKSDDRPFEVVQLFAKDRGQLEVESAAALRALKPGGRLWMAYPHTAEQSESDLNRHHGWSVLHAAGLAGTTEIRLDDSWDAIRFQPASEVQGAAVPAADAMPVGRRASPVFRVVRLAARPLFHVLFRFDVQGRERMPSTAAVVICNHLGWMDAISLLLLFPAEPRIHFLADPTSMMKNRPLWALTRAAGGIVPVDRAQRGDPRLFRHVRRCLDQGGVVALFPEGDFGPSEGQLLPFKKGFAHFAVEAGVPVVPVAMAGMKEIWLGKRLVVRVGEPIPTAGRTVDDVHRLGEQAVNAQLPEYREPGGRKPLRRWLTGLF